MKADFPRIPAAVVIKWPNRVPVIVAREMSRRLADSRIPATWSLEQVSQIEALASWGAVRRGDEAALLLEPTATGVRDEQAGGAELARRLDLLRATGLAVEIVQAGEETVEGSWPRTLRALGVLGVILDSRRATGNCRALPFGVWQFTSQAVAPRTSRWINLFRRRQPLLVAARPNGPAVVTIDLARAGMPNSRPWREVELVISQVSRAADEGDASVETLGQIATRLCQNNAPRPQRSILRAAG